MFFRQLSIFKEILLFSLKEFGFENIKIDLDSGIILVGQIDILILLKIFRGSLDIRFSDFDNKMINNIM